ncbi:uncharacterized protein LOC106637295 [Copidosoma floridanum]|uniref:uncharacterized protein LOC106637295 n=1 Tax=Copidosoma floridanum TaxID=29053 RepID=UPI0006C9767A|nr:uncharacterized protein LOC106637295 [Copidosoma floridanum]
MPMGIGVNLRVTGHCNQGGRKYMEDTFSVAYQQSSNDRELEYAFFGIFDGHGGGEAATFAKENLMDIIIKQKNFWSDNDEDVLKAIRDGYVNTHYAMWKELEKWPRTASGLPSTAGTTASIAFIRKGKIYIGHVGDSAIILGYQDNDDQVWKSKALTRDHKPECGIEMSRIQESGGKVVSKSGVPRVVWNRPRLGHKGPVRRSTQIDEIPFLAVARSLGDLWSYNSDKNTFVVSPEPDVKVIEIDVKTHRCLIFGTDGLWNMLSAQAAVAIAQAAEKHNEKHLIASQQTGNEQGEAQMWINPSKSLVDRALDKWSSTRLRADNTSVVTLMLDPPGPTHSEILLSQKREQMQSNQVSRPVSESQYTPMVRTTHKSTSPSPTRQSPIISCASAEPKISSATNLDVHKHPDSSNQNVTEPREHSSEKINKNTTSPAKDTSKLSQVDTVAGESIQVAEISSSNVSDELNNSSTGMLDESIIDLDHSIVESSICKEDDSNIASEESDASDTKFLLERKSWLQEVPKAEQFSNDLSHEDLQSITCNEPQPHGPRLRRSCVNETTTNSLLTKRVYVSKNYSGSAIMRQTGRKRRHSTDVSQNNQRQQRKSLTSKATSCLSVTNVSKSLKRSCRVMLGNEPGDLRVGVGKQSASSCKYETKNSVSGELCLKRKTRSEDQRNTQDENNPTNQKVENQLRNKMRWSVGDASTSRTNGVLNPSTNGIRERRHSSPNSFKRRSLEKKSTPVKTIRRPSFNRSTSRIQITRDSFWDQGRASRTGISCATSHRQSVMSMIEYASESTSTKSSSSTPKRWLRSDTIAATPIKTLRSRNVDIAGHTVPAPIARQYDVMKSNRILMQAQKLSKQPVLNESILLTAIPCNPQNSGRYAQQKSRY